MRNQLKKYSLQCFSCICIMVFIASMVMNKSYFEAITHESVAWYQCRQVMAILLLYCIGYVFLRFSVRTMIPLFRVLFAFPIGLCLWVFISYLSLLAGFPYTMFGTVLLIIMLLCLTYCIIRRFHPSKDPCERCDLWLHVIVLDIAMLCSTGWLYVMISYDSLFYFINYGRALTVYRSFEAIAGANSFTLTNITQFLPLVCSYTAFWGLDQAYQIHAFLACNVVAVFGVGCYRTGHRSVAFSVLLSAVLVTSTCFLVTSGWFLANMPCMAFIFFLYVTTVLYRRNELSVCEGSMLIGFCLAALALLRKDGIIYNAFFIVWMCSIELYSKKRMAALFAPSAILALSWLAYVRLGVSVSVGRGYYTSIANNKNISLAVAVVIACALYIGIGHDVLKRICSKIRYLHEVDFMYLAFMIGLLYVLKIHFDITIDDWDYAIRNLFLYPSSWGISAVLFGILIMLSLVLHFDLRGDHFVWIGYALLNLISYCYVDNKIFWVNWDDSYNRVLMQIVPVMLLIVGAELERFVGRPKEQLVEIKQQNQ